MLVHELPDFLDAVDIAAHEQGTKMFGDGGGDGCPALGEGRAAQSVEAGLGGLDFDDNQVDAGGSGQDGSYIANGDTHGSLFLDTVAMPAKNSITIAIEWPDALFAQDFFQSAFEVFGKINRYR